MNSKRRKAKKPKYLSLRLQFPANNEPKKRSTKMQRSALTVTNHQLEDRESQDHENVAYFFSADDDAASTLTGLLDSNSSHATNKISSRTDDSSASLTYAYDGESLMRNALRNKERDSSEDKWVCYSEVVDRKVVKEEEVTSSAGHPRLIADYQSTGIQRLSLKLDYQDILNAWSDKGPFYLDDNNSHQIVPDVNDHFLPHDPPSNCGWGCNMGLWIVPKMEGDFSHNGDMKTNNSEEFKIGQREASVLRYKEKRQNRLFSKKIRYEVRKLNAQNRPRLKGRFVKRNESK